MKTDRVTWSWVAFFVSALPIGGVWVFGTFIAAMFREGLDADMNHLLFSTPLHEILGAIVAMGLVGLPLVALGWWLANRTRRPTRNFYLITAGIPTALLFADQLWWVVGAALEPPMNVVPFESNNIFYLPNWLILATIAAAYLAGVWSYLRVVRARLSPASA